jgi:hypothetical protein
MGATGATPSQGSCVYAGRGITAVHTAFDNTGSHGISADFGGALTLGQDGHIAVDGCTLTAFSANADGGAISTGGWPRYSGVRQCHEIGVSELLFRTRWRNL